MLSIVLPWQPWHNWGMIFDEQKIFSIRARLDRPLVLTGMMGVGKTRLGKMLAEALGWPFYDSDEEIEKAAGLSIPEIFEKYGEPHFRDGERRVIKRLLENPKSVIATGGGAVMNPETAADLLADSISIWIKADLDTMVARTAKTDKRPLLKEGDPREILSRLIEVRYPVYDKAPVHVDSSLGETEEIVADMLGQIYTVLMRAGREEAVIK
ncbi:MAG: shikimate kinase [Micavibrio sp.]